jgi:PAS domain S-box-containing protein
MITGAGNETIAVEAMKLGADDYIIKDGESRYLDLIPSVVEKVLLKRRMLEEKKQAEEHLAWEGRINAALASLYVPLVAADSTIVEISHMVLEQAKALTDSAHGYVAEIDPRSRAVVVHTLSQMIVDGTCLIQGNCPVVFPKRADGRYSGLWGHALNTGQPFFTNAPHELGVAVGAPDGHAPVRRFLSVPVMAGTDLLGQIALANPDRDYQERDMIAVERLADYFAIGIQRKRAHDQLEERVAVRTRELQETNELLNVQIKQREALEKVLRSSEEKYRALFEQAPDPVLLVSPETGRFVDFNDKACRNLGYTRDEFTRISVADIEAIESPEDVRRHVEHILEEGAQIFETRHKTKDGRIRDIEVSSRLLKLGKKPYVQSIWRDITDRKTAELAVRESKETLDALLNAITEAVMLLDADGTILVGNRALSERLGLRHEDVVGRTVSELTPADVASRRMEAVRYVFATKKPVSLEDERQGRVIDASLYPALDEHGDVRRVAVFARDVTDWRRAQQTLERAQVELEDRVRERTGELLLANQLLEKEVSRRKRIERDLRVSEVSLRTVLDSAEDWIYVKDRSLRFTQANPAMLNLMGLQSSKVRGKTGDDVLGADDAMQFKEVELRVLGGQSVGFERVMDLGQRSMICSWRLVPMRDRSGRIIGVCGFGRDISELKDSDAATQSGRLGPLSHEYPSEAMRLALDQALLAARTDSIVLLLGESGAGKDFLARYVHDHSPRNRGPFFAVNCAAVPAELAESELFGHESGAFTGAGKRKRGLLELAEGGTLLLNEIGELSLPLQAKLLSFMDSQCIMRVGGQQNLSVDARIIAATNRRLEEDVDAGRFRKDLFFRLNVIKIVVPPLRARLDDIPLLVRALLEGLHKRMGLRTVPLVDEHALEALKSYDWPGNVRELRNVLEKALIRFDRRVIRREDISTEPMPGFRVSEGEISYMVRLGRGDSLNRAVEQAKRFLLEEGLRRSGGSVKEAARLLGVTRSSFNYMAAALKVRRP